MILVMSVAYIKGHRSGLLAGFLSGLLMDFCIGDVIGPFAMLYMLIGYAGGFLNRYFDREDYIMPILQIGAGELAYNIIYYIVTFLFRGKMYFGYALVHVILPRVLYTLLISLLLYKIILIIVLKVNKNTNGNSSGMVSEELVKEAQGDNKQFENGRSGG